MLKIVILFSVTMILAACTTSYILTPEDDGDAVRSTIESARPVIFGWSVSP